jgi:threonine aldolase
MDKISFASDNCSPADKRIIDALISVNSGCEKPYGGDPYTAGAAELLKQEFGNGPDIYFVYNGTAANVISLKGCVRSFEAVITSDISHIDTDEAGAAENICGSKILTVPNINGKITAEGIARFLEYKGSIHQVQPRVVSIAQTTEYGTVYTNREIEAIGCFVHKNDMLLHVDGARIANACVSQGTDLKAMTADTGVDILSLGISKNGGMFGDAVVVFNESLKPDFKYIIKHSLNLHSKNRYIAAQFTEFFKDGLFYRNAEKANAGTREMYGMLKETGLVFLAVPEANEIFVRMSKDLYGRLSEKYFFYNIRDDLYRIMTSYDTSCRDIKNFCDDLKRMI